MKTLPKGQLEARKKRRERNKPVRQKWRTYFRNVVKAYNGGGYDNISHPSQSDDQSSDYWRVYHALCYGL